MTVNVSTILVPKSNWRRACTNQVISLSRHITGFEVPTTFRRSLMKNLDRNNDKQHGLDRLLKASASAIILHQLLRKVQ
ncbi:hypothetical protein ABOM_011500 [Aspergillus bombycis]|uniref:Uncharacterized protein n=1 Tax=Aspergillus bombycis TaxID=109264 RepID=A0A1F7ZJV6_9EURO|nr:hypothetical protein ABOM_011500 [Aspergillus bombycis]OGM39723.1 hypothetical protein ABOM_011500 [Aspergillus bombycis]